MQHAHDLRARRCYGDVPDHPHRHPRRAGSRAEVSQVSRAGRLLRRCLCVPHSVFIRQPSDGVPRVLVSLHTTWMLRFVGVKIQQRSSNRRTRVQLCCTPVFRTRRQRLNPTTTLQLKLLSFVVSCLRAAAFVSWLWVRLFVVGRDVTQPAAVGRIAGDGHALPRLLHVTGGLFSCVGEQALILS